VNSGTSLHFGPVRSGALRAREAPIDEGKLASARSQPSLARRFIQPNRPTNEPGVRADLVKLNVAFEAGGGSVWIKDVELLQAPLG